ncbi:hypothetical protein CLOP_g21205 [Closterium sp. NIES-67]|nr:hypothetical protein CLOP_g21205 [Closterium sp. NIES-67]
MLLAANLQCFYSRSARRSRCSVCTKIRSRVPSGGSLIVSPVSPDVSPDISTNSSPNFSLDVSLDVSPDVPFNFPPEVPLRVPGSGPPTQPLWHRLHSRLARGEGQGVRVLCGQAASHPQQRESGWRPRSNRESLG